MTLKHKKKLELLKGKSGCLKQSQLTVEASPQNPTEDLIEMMVVENIPLNKLDRPSFVSVMENFGKSKLPSRWTATKIMERKCKDYIAKIKSR